MMYIPEANVSVVEATALKCISFLGFCEEKSTVKRKSSVKKNEPSRICTLHRLKRIKIQKSGKISTTF